MSDLNKLKEELEEWQGFYENPADGKNHAFFTTLISAVDQLQAAQQRADRTDAMLTEALESLKSAEAEIARRDKAIKLPGISELIELSDCVPSVKYVSLWDAAISKCADSLKEQGFTVEGD